MLEVIDVHRSCQQLASSSVKYLIFASILLHYLLPNFESFQMRPENCW